MESPQENSITQPTSQTDSGLASKDTPIVKQESIQTNADTAAAEAAAAAKVAAAAAAEAAKVAEALALEAAKVAEAAAAEKLRLEEEAAALKIKEFVEAQSEFYREIHNKIPKVNIHICVKLEELINKSFISIDDIGNSKLNEALKDLNENCIGAFDEFVKSKEAKIAAEQDIVVPKTEEPNSELNESTMETSTTEVLMETSSVITESSVVAETVVNEEASTAQIVSKSNSQNAKVKSNVDTLSGTLFKWKRSNKDKVTPSGKIQSLLQGQLKNNRKSSERPGPNQEKLKEILTRTGYSHEISSGQRKYGGPPPGWSDLNTSPVKQEDKNMDVSSEALVVVDSNEIKKEDDVPTSEEAAGIANDINVKKETSPAIPPQGCECFVGKLPRDLYEDELIPVFEKHGRIWDLRLMIDPSTGLSKGYCFVTYCEKSDAHNAAKALNDFEIRPGKEIRVNISVANIKLFIGNIPKTKTKEELKNEFNKIVEGISEVIIYNQGETENDKLKNRGFCFLEFVDHKSASVAKRKLSLSRFNRFFNREIAVDWADPNDEPDEETMAKVKVLYVKNLSGDVTEEEVQKLFEAYGKLERVRKMKDYAFVHFEQRDDAVKAMEEQNNKVIGKLSMEISLARPLTDKKKQAQQKRQEGNRGNHNNHNNNNNWNNGYNANNRGQNNRNFHNNNGNRGNNQMNSFNGNRNNNSHRGNYMNGINRGGHMGNNRGNMVNRNFNGHMGNMGGNQNYGAQNNFQQQQRNGNMNLRGGTRGAMSNNHRGGFNNNHQAINKRKNNDNNFTNGDQKKGRFGGNNTNFGNGQLMGQNFSGNGNGWNSNFAMSGNDGSNEFYQDNFNSNQWL